MLFSTTSQYAIRGLSELAFRAGQGSMMLEQLVAGTDLPREFLAKVFQQLVKAGILSSAKGRGGGFKFTRPTHDISLLQIMQAIEGPSVCEGCVLGLKTCDDRSPCAQHDLYKPIRHRLVSYLSSTTLADLTASIRFRTP
jgi:Rrf2 family protein